MNNNLAHRIRKAGGISCLFLSAAVGSIGQQNAIRFKEGDQLLFNDLLSFRFDAVRQAANPREPAGLYLSSLSDAAELLLNEDPALIESAEDRFVTRLTHAASVKDPALSILLKAELRFHWFLIYLKHGNEWDAAWNFRQCHTLVASCKKKFPMFEGVRKLDALLSVIIGSVPDRYQWVMNLLDMKGSVEDGMRSLSSLRKKDGPEATELTLWEALLTAYLLQNPDQGFQLLAQLDDPAPLARLAHAAVAVKASRGEDANALLQNLRRTQPAVPITWYVSGEVALQGALYDSAARYFETFLAAYKGLSFVKDAWFKLSICYALLGDPERSRDCSQKAKLLGTDRSEADHYAAMALQDHRPLHLKLLQLRFATDGGFFQTASAIGTDIQPIDLKDKKDSVEFTYRMARLHHKTGQADRAIQGYRLTVERSGDEPWYFAPNSALQLGYLERDSGRKEEASRWFRKAMAYRRHEYKNSIDSKARTALQELNPD